MKRDSFLAQQVALLRRRTGGGVTQLTGDVSAGPGSGSQATTIANDAVTNAKLGNMAADTIKGRANGAGTGDPQDLTANQVSTILDGATDPFIRTSAGASYTDEQAQDAVGTILADTATVDLTYRDIGSPPAIQADVRNASITLAKIQNASANSRLVGSGSAGSGASYSEVSLGSNLTMSGTTLNVTTPLPGGSGGGMVLLEEHTASSSAQLDFTTAFTSTYDVYQIELVNVVPATNDDVLWMRMSTDGGATFDTGANYRWDQYVWRAGGAAADGTGGQTKIVVSSSAGNSNSATNGGVSGTLKLINPLGTAGYKQMLGQVYEFVAAGQNVALGAQIAGLYQSTTAVNAVRFLESTGNIASGTIRIYGLAKT